MTVFLVLAISAGCASKNDALGGSGGSGTGGDGSGGSGTGGASGGTIGTGGIVGDAGVAVPPKLAAAEATWAAMKPSCNTYAYVEQSSSTGYCAMTTIDIENDQPAARYFRSERSACSDVDAGVTEQWEEIGLSQVGTHADGATAWTVEQIFDYCQTILAMNPGAYQISFSVNSEGVPTTCTATLNSCVSDCSFGSGGTGGGTSDCAASCTSGLQISSFSCQPPPG